MRSQPIYLVHLVGLVCFVHRTKETTQTKETNQTNQMNGGKHWGRCATLPCALVRKRPGCPSLCASSPISYFLLKGSEVGPQVHAVGNPPRRRRDTGTDYQRAHAIEIRPNSAGAIQQREGRGGLVAIGRVQGIFRIVLVRRIERIVRVVAICRNHRITGIIAVGRVEGIVGGISVRCVMELTR